MLLSDYINRVNQLYQTGISTEHSFRGILDELLRSIDTSILVTNEPKKIECGTPDYLISRKQIPIGYIEAKDLFDADLDGLKKVKIYFQNVSVSENTSQKIVKLEYQSDYING